MQKQESSQLVSIEITPAEDDDHVSADHTPHEVGSEQVNSDAKGLPTTRDLFSIWLITLFFGTQFMVYMVRNFGKGQYSEQKVAQLTGILAGASSFSRVFTSMLWGKASDITGRMAMITVGNLAIVISILGFGASTDYKAALLWRLIPSAFISNSVALRTSIGEAYSQEGQATALGVFNVGTSLGFVLGSILGGSLSQPCDLYQGFPLCGPEELLQERPFLLPCMVTASLGLLTIVCTVALLKETHPTVKNAPGGWRGHVLRLLTCTAFSKRAADADRVPGAAEDGEEDLLVKAAIAAPADLEMTAPSTASKQPGDSSSEQQGPGEPYMSGRGSSHGSAERTGSLVSEASAKSAILRGENGEAKDELAGEGRPLLQSKDSSWGSQYKDSPQGSGDEQSDSNYRWWRDAAVLKNIIGSGLTTFWITLGSELTPIFVSASQDTGGLGLPLDKFTVPVTVGAVALIGYSLLALPRTTKRFGSLTLVKVGLLAMVPSSLSVPFSSLFAKSAVVTQIMLSIAMIVKGAADTTVMASAMILLNVFAPKSSIGSINGAGQTLINLGRALGPFLSGALWAGAVSLGIPGQQYLAFGVPVLGFSSCYWLYSGLQMPPDA